MKEVKSSKKFLVVMLVVVIALWGINLFVLYWLPANERGTYGDMFGVVNSLFTGLAFAGLLYSTSLQQKEIEQLKNEAGERRILERTNETLKQCQYYFIDMQTTFASLSTKNQNVALAMPPLPDTIPEFTEITHEGLKKYYGYFELVNKALQESTADILLSLRQLEAFAAIMLHGNTDLDLAKKIIGEDYCIWAYKLSGFIAFYRKGDSMKYCENILALRGRLKK
jgi:hypothetical protein